MESWKPCDFKTVLTFYIWLSEVWEKHDLLSVLFGSIVSNYSRIHWQKLISWKFDENFCIFCKIESIYVQINSLQIIKSTQTAVLSRFRFTVFCYTKLVKFCHHVLTNSSDFLVKISFVLICPCSLWRDFSGTGEQPVGVHQPLPLHLYQHIQYWPHIWPTEVKS